MTCSGCVRAATAVRWPSTGTLANARALGLSRVLLTSVVGHVARPDLEERFALDVLAFLPEDGFVLESDAILLWLHEALEIADSAQLKRTHRTWFQRLRAVFHSKTPPPLVTDA